MCVLYFFVTAAVFLYIFQESMSVTISELASSLTCKLVSQKTAFLTNKPKSLLLSERNHVILSLLRLKI